MNEPRAGRKAEVYRWIKIGGSLSLLPFVLSAGPIAGYILAEWLDNKFGLPSYASALFIVIGFIASATESVRIIKFALRSESNT